MRSGSSGVNRCPARENYLLSRFLYHGNSSTYHSVTHWNILLAKVANHTDLKYGLDPSTKAYGDPTDLSLDPDIDLVVCCTRVDTHYALTKPSIEAGKPVFVEWPLTHDVERSRELADLVAKKGSRSMVGLQGQLTPVLLKIKDLLQQGSIGKVLSSEVRAHGGTVDREKAADGLRYFTDINIGGNVFMIGFAHRKFKLFSSLHFRENPD